MLDDYGVVDDDVDGDDDDDDNGDVDNNENLCVRFGFTKQFQLQNAEESNSAKKMKKKKQRCIDD